MNLPKPTLSRDEAMKLWLSEHSEYAKEQVVLNNVGLVGLVMKRLNLNLLDEDLFSVGILGLVKATLSFDCDKGIEFSTFTTRVIQNEILMTFRKKRITSLLYLDELFDLGDGDKAALSDVIADKRNYENEVISEISVENMIAKLSDKESQILYLYAVEHMKQKEIAKLTGLSQSYISKILGKIQKKLEKEFDY